MTRQDDSPPDEPDLVQLLVLEAGRLMEDHSAEFAMRLPVSPSARLAKLKQMQEFAETTEALVKAALALALAAALPARE